jgi:hypothetical protein
MIPAIGDFLTALCMYFIVLKHYKIAAADTISSAFLYLRYWELFLILLVIYSAWICPFELAFLRDLPSELLLVENIVNSFFAIDIVLTFFLAYVDSKTHLLVDDRKRIAVRFISGS